MAAHAGAAAGDNKREARTTVWTVADVTRDREKQENVFQELQHAIDYLDHAPAGFFSVDAAGNIVYLNATLATWLEQDLAEVGSGGLKLSDVVTGESVSLLSLPPAPGEVTTEVLDLDFKTRSGRSVPVRLFHKVAFGADGTPGTSRTLVLNRARGAKQDGQRAAEVRFMRFFNNTPMAIATVDRSGRIVRSNALFARLFKGLARRRQRTLDPYYRRRTRSRGTRTGDREGGQGQGDIEPVDAALPDSASARRASSYRHREMASATAKRPSSMRSRPPSSAHSKARSGSSKRWNRSASSPAASRTTSTTCSPPS